MYILCAGSELTRLEAVDHDDDQLQFAIVGDSQVLAAGPLLRVVSDGPKSASVFLSAALNAVVRPLVHVVCLLHNTHRDRPPPARHYTLYTDHPCCTVQYTRQFIQLRLL